MWCDVTLFAWMWRYASSVRMSHNVMWCYLNCLDVRVIFGTIVTKITHKKKIAFFFSRSLQGESGGVVWCMLSKSPATPGKHVLRNIFFRKTDPKTLSYRTNIERNFVCFIFASPVCSTWYLLYEINKETWPSDVISVVSSQGRNDRYVMTKTCVTHTCHGPKW